MTIEYTATQKDVSAAYSYAWKHSSYMRHRIYLLAAGFVLSDILLRYLGYGYITVRDCLYALGYGAAFVLILPYFLRLRTKRDKRTLSIDPVQISTQIGRLKGDVPWKKVESISVTGEHIFIVRRNLNSFAIPQRAFKSEVHRNEFAQLCQRYFALSKEAPP
jgi:hypothetical protein